MIATIIYELLGTFVYLLIGRIVINWLEEYSNYFYKDYNLTEGEKILGMFVYPILIIAQFICWLGDIISDLFIQ